MRTKTAATIRLADYAVPDILVPHIDLAFSLAPEATEVTAQFSMQRNPAGRAGAPLVLDGDEVTLLALAMDGKALSEADYVVTPESLTIPRVPDAPFTLTIKTRINPAANTKLMGLYRSNGVYCTQCEADGFRRITYCLDRPDVMSTWRVRIEAEKREAPLLLSNGNPIEGGDISGTTRHFALWEDPHKKPCYLFALVAGDLDAVSDHFITRSGRRVALNVYVERGKAPRAAYAMDALKRSMRWDEEAFGCEYDLDLFNIVAVSDFNMGAMENKGLNIFNDRYILASEDTATDQDYHNIEAVVAHEYFHNWTGNRITCRDWFQLCLKEGLTVFRDQEFSSDMRSRPVERIANVQTLRAAQFVEDAGPLAHPVRPQAYKEINNFYTATVYNKGAEVIRMLKTLIGDAAFRAGMDLYFARHDGEATTIEAFIACFAEVSKHNLVPFMRWYDQAGTPVLSVSDTYDAQSQSYTLSFAQHTNPTPGQPEKGPQVIPIKLGLVAENGEEIIGDTLFVLKSATASTIWQNIPRRPIPSLLRDFSAPVKLEINRQPGDLLVLAQHDSDPFNRWQALQDAEIDLLKRSVAGIRKGEAPLTDQAITEAIRSLVLGSTADPAFAALAIALPGEADMAREIGTDVDPEAIGQALDALRTAIAKGVAVEAKAAYTALAKPQPFSPDGASAGRRALIGQLLRLLTAADEAAGAKTAFAHFEAATNMSERIYALRVLTTADVPEREAALHAFETRYGEDALMLDMWFSLKAVIAGPGAVNRARALMQHPKFTLSNPNRARSVIGAFASGNPRGFHAADGAGYDFVAEMIGEIDQRNPQIAARLATSFRTWRNLEAGRRAKAEAALRRLAASTPLSRDLGDILERSLAG